MKESNNRGEAGADLEQTRTIHSKKREETCLDRKRSKRVEEKRR